ncbi:MAG: bifunctional metallophosphatase/5'-nucleotidase, partial [Bdellovibrio sp.]|nr:bifunctional metallophosphatase/5'-nucleotidase [Bdellovibrio sp.]
MNNNKPLQNTIIFLLIILLTQCSTGQKLSTEVTSGLPKHDLEVIVLMGINDFHGALSPHILKTKEALDVTPITYEKGGASILASHINILKSQFGKRFFLLDAGDEFQGSVESNLEEGAPVVQFFNQLEVRAAAIGNHEFDYGPVGPEGSTGDLLGALKERLKQAHYPYLAANINDRDTGKLTALPNTLPSYLTQVGRLKIGVIGVSTTETPKTTRPDQIRSLVFTDLKEAVLRETKNLRAQGAQ